MTCDTCEIKRLIALIVAPIKLLPFETDYKKGQLDMADTITHLVEVSETKIGTDIADKLDEAIDPKEMNLDELLKIRDALTILNSFQYNWANRKLQECNAAIQIRINTQEGNEDAGKDR